MTAKHLFSVGSTHAWRDGLTAEIVSLVPAGSPYAPDPVNAFYVVLFHGRERVTVSQRALLENGRAA
jgi:hypothetical protein